MFAHWKTHEPLGLRQGHSTLWDSVTGVSAESWKGRAEAVAPGSALHQVLPDLLQAGELLCRRLCGDVGEV